MTTDVTRAEFQQLVASGEFFEAVGELLERSAETEAVLTRDVRRLRVGLILTGLLMVYLAYLVSTLQRDLDLERDRNFGQLVDIDLRLLALESDVPAWPRSRWTPGTWTAITVPAEGFTLTWPEEPRE